MHTYIYAVFLIPLVLFYHFCYKALIKFTGRPTVPLGNKALAFYGTLAVGLYLSLTILDQIYVLSSPVKPLAAAALSGIWVLCAFAFFGEQKDGKA